MATEQLTRLVRLQIEANQALRELAAIRRETQSSNRNLNALSQSSRQATRQLQTMGRGVASLGAATRTTNRSLSTMNTQLNTVSRSADLFRSALAGAIGVYGVQELGSSLRSLVEIYQKMQNQAKLVTTAQDGVSASTERVAAEMQDLAGIAERSFGEIESTTNSYFRLSQIFRDLPEGVELAKVTTEALNKAFILSGATAREQTNAMYQLSQAFSSGTFNGDEFRSVAEQGVRIMTALQNQLRLTADGLVLFEQGMDELSGTTKVTIADLRAFGAEGVLTTDLVIRAILREIPKLNEELSNVNITVDRAASLFRDRFALELGALLDGPIAAFSGALREIALNMTPAIDGVTRFGVALAALGAIAAGPALLGLIKSFTTLTGGIRLAVLAFAAISDAGAAEIFDAIGSSVRSVVDATTDAANAVGGFEQVLKALVLVGGGVAALRLGAVFGGWALGAAKTVIEMKRLAVAQAAVVAPGVRAGYAGLVTAITAVSGSVRGLTGAMVAANVASLTFSGALRGAGVIVSGGLARAFAAAAGAVRLFSRALVATGIGALVVGAGLLVAEFVKLRSELGSTRAVFDDLGLPSWADAWGDITDAVEELIDATGDYIASLPTAGIMIDRLSKASTLAIESMVSGYRGLGAAVESIMKGIVGFVLLPFEAATRATKEFYDALALVEGLPGFERLGISARETSEGMGRALDAMLAMGRSGAAEAGERAAGHFRDMADNALAAFDAVANLGAELTEAEQAIVASASEMREQARAAEERASAERRAAELEKELAENQTQAAREANRARAEANAELAEFLNGLAESVDRQNVLVGAVKDGKEAVEALQSGFQLADRIKEAQAEYVKLATAAKLTEDEIAAGRQNVAELLTAQAQAAGLLAEGLSGLADEARGAGGSLRDLSRDLEEFWTDLERARDAAIGGARAAAESREAYEAYQDALADREELAQAIEEFERLAEAMNLDEESEAYKRAVAEIGAVVGETQKARKAIEENLAEPAENAGTRLGSTFANAFNSAFGGVIGAVSESGSFHGGLRDLASTITGGLTNDLAKNLGDELKSLKGAFKDLFSGLFDGQGQLFGLDNATITGIGAGIGIGISGILSGNSQQIGAGIGTAAGAALGSFIPVIGTSLGAALGGIVGSLASSLFGSKPSGSATAFTAGAQAGEVVYRGSGSLRQAGTSAAEAVADVLGLVREMFSVTTEGITRIVADGLRGDNIDVTVASGPKALAEFGINKEAGLDLSDAITELGAAMQATGEITRRELDLIESALDRSGDDPEAFARIIQQAYAFRDQIKAAAREYVTGVDETATTYQQAFRNIRETFSREATADVRALGVTTREIVLARRQARRELREAYNFDVASQLVETGYATREGIDAWFALVQEQFQRSRQAAIATAKEIGGDVELTKQLYAAQYQVLRDQYRGYLDELTNETAAAAAATQAAYQDALRNAIGSALQSGEASAEALDRWRRLTAQQIQADYEVQRQNAIAAGAGRRDLELLQEVLLDLPMRQLREDFRQFAYEIENAAAIAREAFEDVLRGAIESALQTGDVSAEAISRWRAITERQIRAAYEEQRRAAVAAGAAQDDLAILREVMLDIPLAELAAEFEDLAAQVANAAAALRSEFESVLLNAISGALQSGQADAAALAKFRELSSAQIRAEYEEQRQAAVAAGATQAELALLRRYMLDLPLSELTDQFNRFSDEISGVLDAIAEAEGERADVLAELTRRANELRAAEEALADARRDLVTSDLSPGDERSQLAAIRAQFDDLVSAGAGGNAQAAQDAARLAQALLQQGQAVYGSSTLYGELFKDVNTALAALESSVAITADRIESELTAESFDEITQRTTNQLLAALAQLDQRLEDLYRQSLSQSQSTSAAAARNATGVAA
ncbi:MAG: tape measure protein [Pikeienuella sp.]|uniref:tape measure protein n=1 Tax=Pikeienuella sp. TaxID=2831957 RepID=UPI0039187656